MRSIVMALALLLPLLQPRMAHGQDSEALKRLQQENQRLQRELQDARQRIRELESMTGAKPVQAPQPPAGSRDPGTEPWGNPNAVLRSLAVKLREDLQEKGQAIPTPDADRKVWSSYRQRATRWIEVMQKFEQPIEWRVRVSECVQVNAQPRELEFVGHVLRADGSRVEPAFTFRCPATSVPDLEPAKAIGDWILRARVLPQFTLQPEITSEEPANPFGLTPTIAPQMEARLRFVVQSLQPAPAVAP
ncbi:MAG: hypothetical protein ACO32J_03755 [Phycisphaerales bacterium]|jgi:hypothetical protein